MTIYLLTIIATHDFDAIVHISAHVSHEAAQTYADDVALPDARAGDNVEWESHFIPLIEELEFHAG